MAPAWGVEVASQGHTLEEALANLRESARTVPRGPAGPRAGRIVVQDICRDGAAIFNWRVEDDLIESGQYHRYGAF